MSKQIYIAAPFTADNEEEFNLNVACARWHGMQVAKMGGYPVMPTSNTCYGFRHLQSAEFWYENTEALLDRCDALFVCGGLWSCNNSSGVKREWQAAAAKRGFQIFTNLHDLNAWLNPTENPVNFDTYEPIE